MTLERPIGALHSKAMYARDAASIATPIGLVRVTGTADRIDSIAILVGGDAVSTDAPAIREALRQIEAYFARRLTAFDLPLAPSPTDRGAVLRQGIVDIGYGQTASYGALAKAIRSSPRAIGQACAPNPLPAEYAPRLPPAPRIRWQGTMIGNGLRAQAWPIARGLEWIALASAP